jgi:hypothetical protein
MGKEPDIASAVMPVPDQVRDDGSGIQRATAFFYWIPARRPE